MHWFMIGLRSWSIGWRMNRGCMDWDNRSCMVNWGVDKRRMMSYRGMNRMMSYRSMDQWCMMRHDRSMVDSMMSNTGEVTNMMTQAMRNHST